MSFLDNTGLAHFASWVKDRLDKKFDKSGGTIGNGAIENLADRNGIEISGYKNGTSDTSLMLDQTKATFSHRIYGDIGPAVVSGVAVPKSDTDAANKAYVDSCKTPVPSGEGELAYVQVTSWPSAGESGILDCIVPAWVSIKDGANTGRLRLLSPAVLLRSANTELGYLYVHIIGGKYQFSSLNPTHSTGGDRVSILCHGSGSGGVYTMNYLCLAEVLNQPDEKWSGSAAGDARILVGSFYIDCGGNVYPTFYHGNGEVLPDFNNEVIRV